MARTRILSYERIKSRYGYVFISLWLIGFVLLFLVPFISSLVYSFCKVTVSPGALDLEYIGWENFNYILRQDASFMPSMTSTVSNAAYKTPLIVLFSLFVALMLNQNFKGRTLARSIFFLPVIVMSGPVQKTLMSDSLFGAGMGTEESSAMLEITSAQDLLESMGLTPMVSDYIMNIVNELFNLSWSSGIQILIFISALQSVPDSHYEVASIEGATPWESFWKITIPSIAPMTVVAIVYTLIDMLLGTTSDMNSYIHSHVVKVNMAEAATAASLSFFFFALLVLTVFYIANRYVHYTTN